MTLRPLALGTLFVALGVMTTSCAGLQSFAARAFSPAQRSQPLQMRAVNPLPTTQASLNADFYYGQATEAIGRRDYARALELLQAARARAPSDVRVLNAFGVVYDKMGRFDLSARYYAQALALDANSSVVMANLAYSRRLQGLSAEPQAAPRALAASPTPPHPARAQPSQGTPPANVVLATAAPVRRPGLIGRPLEIIDASGAGAGLAVRTALADRGWTAPRVAATRGNSQATTTIRYTPDSASAAQALQRTLPGSVEMIQCTTGCVGVRLTVGRDAVAWRLPSGPPRPS